MGKALGPEPMGMTYLQSKHLGEKNFTRQNLRFLGANMKLKPHGYRAVQEYPVTRAHYLLIFSYSPGLLVRPMVVPTPNRNSQTFSILVITSSEHSNH